MSKLIVNVGVELSKIVTGMIITELDVRICFDKKEIVDRAKKII